ncbi:HPr kinase/phosphorylase [Granulicatella sp. zg-ZJ]|uniref:HPr(Ser) kinase/phosphatase n=1 Tax=unclassified Granulicatella TaxID=2630493 RepID=UPI0013BFE121|nr:MULTISPECIES: HPr(Ser) kinase/phosphatase [unclassified Granulicatella]MBS4750490.1 HPr kinase/phosphorylase [Carnobacteriaceae bacterium zg-ZUI78]NEW62566.1 HPr kinase/phosphorylase [Granulicatella sp. zg-ZJ]NEW66115.1 HPr kinase/phosphorylase [Granulicatella sp. zg-84]QMI85444.1 HPr kinase/phosphorylase [Carnobacteriaceae bacterium zg-84]
MTVTVQELVNTLRLKVQHGEAFLERHIFTSELSRPGVELTGYFEYYDERRIQVLGMTEISFIQKLDKQEALDVMRKLCAHETPAFIIARNLEAPMCLVEAAEKACIPILQTSSKTTSVISNLTNYLESKLAERVSMHGVFIDIFGVGVLLTGDSGVGKSETALELLQQGHRLVADDRVDFYQVDELTLIGESPSILKNLLEVRGIGIIDVMTLFGVGSVRDTKKLDLIVRLEVWNEHKTFDRLGNGQQRVRILDVDVPQISIPVKMGRNLANIVEVATMNYRAKGMGFDATEVFQNNLNKLIQENTKN